MALGWWPWDQRGDKATRGHKHDRNMSPNQGTSGSPRAAVPEVPKTPHHSPSAKSPPLAEVLLAPGLQCPPGTGMALLHLDLLVLHNRDVSICPATDTQCPGPAGRAPSQTAQDTQPGAMAARVACRYHLQLAALQLGGCTTPKHPPSTSLTLHTSQHFLMPRKWTEGDPQNLPPTSNVPSPSGMRPHHTGLAAESRAPPARWQDEGPAREPSGHRQGLRPASFCPFLLLSLQVHPPGRCSPPHACSRHRFH